jgi:DNA-binding MarR family transcriptional regulator
MAGMAYSVRADLILRVINTRKGTPDVPSRLTYGRHLSDTMAHHYGWADSTTQRVLRRMRTDQLIERTAPPDTSLAGPRIWLRITPRGHKRLAKLPPLPVLAEDTGTAGNVTAHT